MLLSNLQFSVDPLYRAPPKLVAVLLMNVQFIAVTLPDTAPLLSFLPFFKIRFFRTMFKVLSLIRNILAALFPFNVCPLPLMVKSREISIPWL